MKANELMIGDWVKVNPFTRLSHLIPEKYESILEEEIQVSVSNISGSSRFHSIPLTEKILKANGFEDCGNRYDVKVSVLGREDSHDTFSIAKDWVNPNVLYFRVSMMFPRLHYVHELQHALRLCGLNELADNFKLKE